MQLIEMMPTYLGQQLYPAGLPLPADKVSINGKTVMDMFLETSQDEERYKEVEGILNDYYRYHLLAPCFDLGKWSKDEIMSADGDRLFEICMDLGIDPL